MFQNPINPNAYYRNGAVDFNNQIPNNRRDSSWYLYGSKGYF